MGMKNPDPDDCLTIPRRGPLELPMEEHRERTTCPDSGRRTSDPSQSPLRAVVKTAASETATKTRGEIEAAICDGIRRFELESHGRGPKDIHAHLIGDLLLLRLFDVLTVAERRLTASPDVEKSRDLVKQVRNQLIEAARPILESLILEVTGVPLVSVHHDLSTKTGEECFLFTLASAPGYRDAMRKEK